MDVYYMCEYVCIKKHNADHKTTLVLFLLQPTKTQFKKTLFIYGVCIYFEMCKSRIKASTVHSTVV